MSRQGESAGASGDDSVVRDLRAAGLPPADARTGDFVSAGSGRPPGDRPEGAGAGGDDPRIAGYEVLGKCGEGGMGTVYVARQLALNRVVAVKVMTARRSMPEQAVRRFRTEIEALTELGHPGIVQIYDCGSTEGDE